MAPSKEYVIGDDIARGVWSAGILLGNLPHAETKLSDQPDQTVPPILDPPVEKAWVEPEPLPGIPFPPAIIAFFAIVGVTFVFALTRAPHAFALGKRYEQGHRAYEAGDMKKAAELLAPVVKEFPQAKDVQLDLAQAYAQSGQIEAAIRELSTFQGTMVTDEEGQRLDSIAAIIERQLPPEAKGGKQ